MAILEAKTKYGVVLGLPSANQANSVFKGIPFAKPPVGDLRWKAPQKPDPWDEPYKAYTFASIPYQSRIPPGTIRQKEMYPTDWPVSEDCLYLNIWTPAQSPEERLPVAFWIFGGGFNRGYSNKQETDGDGFAKRGCVYVEFNYRLGIFGFLAHPELRSESPYGASGNYGSLDQIAALEWVKENITAFGGDPERITVFGQSAGAMSTMHMMTSPLSKDNVHQAIMQSGGGIYPMESTLSQVEAQGEDFAAFCGAISIADMREMPAETLFEKYLAYSASHKVLFRPCVDGYVFPKDPRDIILNNECPDIPCIIGHNSSERDITPKALSDASTLAQGEAWIRARYGEHADKILAAENLQTDGDVLAYMLDNMDRLLIPGTYAFADVYGENKKNVPVYVYKFSHEPPGTQDMGVYHSAEKQYVFETVVRSWRPMTWKDYKLSITMADYWANFVRTGIPNDDVNVTWEPYNRGTPSVMHLQLENGMEPVKLADNMENYRMLLRESAIRI